MTTPSPTADTTRRVCRSVRDNGAMCSMGLFLDEHSLDPDTREWLHPEDWPASGGVS